MHNEMQLLCHWSQHTLIFIDFPFFNLKWKLSEYIYSLVLEIKLSLHLYYTLVSQRDFEVERLESPGWEMLYIHKTYLM